MHILIQEQVVKTDLASAWDFLKTPANLNKITPDDLQFKIVSDVPDEMHDGLLVEYHIRIPYFGRRKWLAEIKHIREQRSFVDEQRIGPYNFWYHYHELQEELGAVRIIDRVYYELPFGPLGTILHFFCIRKTLERIFRFRKGKLAEIFNDSRNQ